MEASSIAGLGLTYFLNIKAAFEGNNAIYGYEAVINVMSRMLSIGVESGLTVLCLVKQAEAALIDAGSNEDRQC